MKIAFFHELPPGGARRAVNEIAGKLKKNNQIDLYYVDNIKSLNEQRYYQNVYFYKFLAKNWCGHNWKIRLYKDTIELIKLYFLHKKIASDIRSKNYDILFIHASKFTQSPFMLRFTNKLKVFYCHDPHYRIIYEQILDIPKGLDVFRFVYEKINRFNRMVIDRINIKKADLVLANSEFTESIFKRTYGKESRVCYLGVDSNFFRPETKTSKEFDILYIGSNEPVDGKSLLTDSLRLLPFKPKVREILIENEWISDDLVLLNLYRKSRIVVCTAYNEPLGLVAIEAMSCGVPVLSVNEGGYKETVKDGITGYLINRDPIKFSNKIKWMLDNPKVLKKIGENARKLVIKKWTWENSADRIMNVFSSLRSHN